MNGCIKGLEPYQQRVVDEKHQLDAKISKLEVFITSPTFNDLRDIEKDLLISQCNIMKSYSAILNIRINIFI